MPENTDDKKLRSKQKQQEPEPAPEQEAEQAPGGTAPHLRLLPLSALLAVVAPEEQRRVEVAKVRGRINGLLSSARVLLHPQPPRWATGLAPVVLLSDPVNPKIARISDKDVVSAAASLCNQQDLDNCPLLSLCVFTDTDFVAMEREAALFQRSNPLDQYLAAFQDT